MFTQTHAKAIVDLMHKAKLHIDYPKVRLQSKAFMLQLSVAGPSANMPNSINITDGKPFGSSTFYGRIFPDGIVKFSLKTSVIKIEIISHELELFAEAPTEYAKLYSNTTGNCMFCTKTLTDPQSVVVGYGPICAAHYGLPHGEIDKQVANDMTQIEMSLDKLDKLQIPETIEDVKCQFNSAINFALDDAEGEAISFLLLWREGDWESIKKEFPTFKFED